MKTFIGILFGISIFYIVVKFLKALDSVIQGRIEMNKFMNEFRQFLNEEEKRPPQEGE